MRDQSFIDSQGRQWHFTIDNQARQEIKRLFGVDLLRVTDNPFDDLSADATFRLMAHLLREQAQVYGLSEDELTDELTMGHTATAAVKALVCTVINEHIRLRPYAKKKLEALKPR